MPTHDEDNLDPLAALMAELDALPDSPDTPPLPHYIPNTTFAREALYSMTNAGYFDGALEDEYGFPPGMKTGRLRYQEQRGTATMTVAQLTHKILTLEWEQRHQEELRDKSQRRYGNPAMYEHNPYRLAHVIRELAALKRTLLSRLIREHEAQEAARLKTIADLEAALLVQPTKPVGEPPPCELLTDTIVIAPGAPGRD